MKIRRKVQKTPHAPAGWIPLSIDREAERLHAALHESFHVIAAWAQGLRLGRVTLNEDEARGEHERFAAFTARAMGTNAQNARVSLAGLIADQLLEEQMGRQAHQRVHLRPADGGQHHDMVAAVYWAMAEVGPGVTDESKNALLDRWDEETRDLLRPRVDVAFKLRDRLFAEGALDEPALLKILGPYPVQVTDVD